MADPSDPLLDDDQPDDPAVVEQRAEELLAAAFRGETDVFESAWLKLAKFTGDGRTRLRRPATNRS